MRPVIGLFPRTLRHWFVVVLPQYKRLLCPASVCFPLYSLFTPLPTESIVPRLSMSYRPLATPPRASQPIDISSSARSRRRSPSLARSAYSREDSDSGQSQGWCSPFYRPKSSASRSSGGYSSDLIFPMDSERASSSSSSRHGSVEPAFLYDIPTRHPPPSSVPSMPVCSDCGQRVYGLTPTQNHDRSSRSLALLCPSCQTRGTWQQAPREPSNDDCYGSAGYHPPYTMHERHPASYQPRWQVPRERQRVQSTSRPHFSPFAAVRSCSPGASTHVLGRAFPSFGAPVPPRHASQPFPPSSWIDPRTLPPATLAVGSYHREYQLPRLISQVQQRAPPASNISRPRTADPFGVSSSSRYTQRRQ